MGKITCSQEIKTKPSDHKVEKIWYEKTVEYKFVLEQVYSRGKILPFDGNAEKAGDAILKSFDKWILIEFKRGESDLSSEKKKFKNYKAAKEKSNTLNKCGHIIVYGVLNDNIDLNLKCIPYFFNNVNESVEAGSWCQFGLNFHEMELYMRELIHLKKEYKNKSETSENEGANGGSDGGCVVMAANEEGVLFLSLNELSLCFDLKKQIRENEQKVNEGKLAGHSGVSPRDKATSVGKKVNNLGGPKMV